MITDPITSQKDPSLLALESLKVPIEARVQHLRSASVEFEAILIQQMLQSMEDTLQNGGLVGSGTSGSVYSGILTQAISKSMAEHQSFGLADQLYRQTIQHDPEIKKYIEAHPKEASLHPNPISRPGEGNPLTSPILSDPQNTPLESGSKADISTRELMPLNKVRKDRIELKNNLK